jgi:hypothetical protein
MVFPGSDIISIFSEEKWLFKTSIWNLHQFPLWNPYVFSGSPFIGNPTGAMFYPVNILFLLFPLYQTFGYIFILDVFLLSFFTYLFARLIKLSAFSSFLSAIIFAFSAPVITRIIPGHVYLLDIMVWFPPLLYCFESFLQKRKFSYIVFSGICIGLMLLAGGSQIAFYTLISSCIYIFIRRMSDPTSLSFSSLCIFIVASFLIGISLSMVQLLPTQEFSYFSIRGDGLSKEFASSFSLHPYQLISVFFPFFFGFGETYWGKGNFIEDSLYAGIFPIFFCGYALLRKKNKYVLPILTLLVISLIYSFGKYTPVWSVLYYYIPGFNLFRTPARILFIYTFSLSILSGIGLDLLMKEKKLRFYYIFFFIALIGVIVFMYFLLYQHPIHQFEIFILMYNRYGSGVNHEILYFYFLRDIAIVTVSFFLLGLFIFLKEKHIISKTLFQIFIITAVFFDLWTYGHIFVQTTNPSNIGKQSELFTFIRRDHGIFRVFDLSTELFYGQGLPPLQDVLGVHSLQLKTYRDFLWQVGPHEETPHESFFIFHGIITNPQILALLNVKYIISNTKLSLSFLKPLFVSKNPPSSILFGNTKKLNTYYLYENMYFLPRAFFVTNPNLPVMETIQKETNISIISYQPNTIKLLVTNAKPGYLILSENWYPGWKAYDRGKEINIEKKYAVLRAIYLMRGKHTITFIYNPLSFQIGKMISFLTSIFLFILFVYRITIHRRYKNKYTNKLLAIYENFKVIY